MTPFAEQAPDFTATDPYAVLGLNRTATLTEIKRTYFRLIRQYPPETEGETFKIIRAAYEKIKNVKRRDETDIFLPQPPPEWSPPSQLPQYDTKLPAEIILTVLDKWGDLGRTDFQDDFREIKL